MKEIIKMLVVLTLISAVCGFLLAFVRDATKDTIEEQLLVNVKGPAVEKVLADADSTDDLIKDRRKIEVRGEENVIFIGKKNGKPWAFAFEVSSKGFGGDIGVIVGFAMDKDIITGVGITTHKETPGLGAKIKSEDMFTDQFRNRATKTVFKVKKDNGEIDAISGATVSSRGVCKAIETAIDLSKDIRSKL